MALSRDRCICVRKVEYSETSQILTLFGREHGLFKVIAKGAHRRTKAGYSKFDGGADLLDVGYANFTFDTAKELNTLTEWNLREGNLPLRRSLRGMHLGLYSAELVSELIQEHDPHPDLYVRLEKSLREMGSERCEEVFLAFQLDLLHQAGHLSDPGVCVACGRSVLDGRPAFFSTSQGGAICRDCERTVSDRFRFEPRLLGLAQQLLKIPRIRGVPQTPLPRLLRQQTDPLNRLFASQVHQILGRRSRMSAYVIG